MQLELFEIKSPCIGVCQTNRKGFCLGCARSRAERQHWLRFSEDEKRVVILLCKERFKRARRAKMKRDEERQEDAVIQNDLFGLDES